MSDTFELDNFEVAVLAHLFQQMRYPAHTIHIRVADNRLHFQLDYAGFSPPMGRIVS